MYCYFKTSDFLTISIVEKKCRSILAGTVEQTINIKVQRSRVSTRNFILGGKLTNHVALRPRRGESIDFIIVIIGNILGGWEVSCLGAPSLEETLEGKLGGAVYILLGGGRRLMQQPN